MNELKLDIYILQDFSGSRRRLLSHLFSRLCLYAYENGQRVKLLKNSIAPLSLKHAAF